MHSVNGVYDLTPPQFNMMVTFTYHETSIDDQEVADPPSSRSAAAQKQQPEMKTFSFYTLVDLGPVAPREEPRTSFDREDF
jgi:dynactin-4